MRLLLTVVDDVGETRDLHLDADPETRVGAIAEQLGVSTLYVEGVPVPAGLTLHASPLRDAVVVGTTPGTTASAAEPRGVVEIRTVSGVGAGGVRRLDIGDYHVSAAGGGGVLIGRFPPGGRALRLRIEPGGRCLLTPPPGPASTVRLDREPLAGPTEWPLGGSLEIGGALLEPARPEPPDAALQRSEDGAAMDYNRPPRLIPPTPPTEFKLPIAPGEPEKRPLPYIAAIAPLVFAVAGVIIFDRLSALLFGLLSPLVIIGNYLSSKRSGKVSHKERVRRYEVDKERITADAREAVVAERRSRREAFPDPASLLLTAVGPRRRLWERRRTDGDFLTFRVGTADQPSGVLLEDPSTDLHKRKVTEDAYDVPVTVDLRRMRVLGIAGSGPAAAAVVRSVVAQAVVLHSPRDLKLYVLSGQAGQAAWGWVRWLPHVRPEPGQDTTATIGTATSSIATRVAELSAMIEARAAAGSGAVHGTVLVVFDGARRLRSLPGVVQILRDGPAVGVHAICLDAEERLLPEECLAVVAEQPDGRVKVGRSGEKTLAAVRVDEVTREWGESIGRVLGVLRDPGGADTEDSVLPASVRLLDVIAMDRPSAEAVAARWRAGGRTTSAVMGISLDGAFSLDIRRDGPHGLVAGTTGAGKSELLQTLVASLAAGNRPDAMTFVLVDYKGGSAFKECVALPHTVGMVTDLDTHLVERALVSLGAELRRREHILAAAGAKDIEDYIDLTGRQPGLAALPRLLIVIDEFASLARELPDFVKGLVNIAQRGRSLGIHLILATQRPGGVVSPEIRANTNLRIALRMTDKSESTDVISSPEAASIAKSAPGRAYVRLGQNTLIPFQAARVGGRRPGATTVTIEEPWIRTVLWENLGDPVPARPRPAAAPASAGEIVTDLADLVAAIRGANTGLGIPEQHSPWLPALTGSVALDDLPQFPSHGYDLAPVGFGLVDLPAEQARTPLTLDFAGFGHLHLIGSPRSGRSQALRTIAGAIARAHRSSDVHLYGIDCGNGALLALETLPHTGAVVQRTQPDRMARLVARLTREVARRQELLSRAGAADLPELRRARPAEQRPPHLVVLFDRWEVFDKTLTEYDGGALLSGILTLLREGASVGVHLIIAGDRSMFSTRLSATTEDKLVLRLNDKSEYMMIGVPQRAVPDDIPAGRALRAGDKAELQIALLPGEASGQGQAAALQAIALAATARDADLPVSGRPFRVDQLPDRLGLSEAAKYTPVPRPGPLWALAGVGGDELAALGPDLAINPTFVIGGPPRSGRSNTLLVMALSLLEGGTRLIVVAPRRSPLRDLAGRPGVLEVFAGDDVPKAQLTELLAGTPEPVVIVMDDADNLAKSMADSLLTEIARTGAEKRRGLVVAGQTDRLLSGFSGWIPEVRRNRQGLLISPQAPGDGELIGGKVPRSRLGGDKPGRAFLSDGTGKLTTIQIPEAQIPA
ncbi:FtsK/SpoIIIE domain-containing protein [Actinoplanes couchii]|uniref:Cell division protein FtsK n=1 Tax=Actinoplanes couchii TaxID=403638 RepID=A0ABQ3XD56_9ACTN|nr:FtsK/SpoIIIE domain-containing protein [Actinoplanes couchii]MDR6321332.1 S-DNA-T family DNA segregation ATPase FtsK/SpoIIIE [Actinoplanes couchii]GID56442.1 cell division protein FtsK [Actinoplanes couchii]